jgi:transmembrane sensor
MLKNHDIAALLIKHNNQETTPEEEKVLQDWRHESQENEDCYNRLTDFEYVLKRATQYMYNKPDVGLAYHQVMETIEKQRKRRRYFIIVGATAVAASIIWAIVGQPFWNHKAPTSNTTTIAKRTIKPPASAPFGKALLVIEDEDVIELDTAKDGLIASYGNVSIEKVKQEIRYRSMGNSPTGGSVYSKLITGQACEYRVVLPDNSAIEVSPSSWIRQNIVPIAQERRAEMGGRAYFTITHNDQKPFVVSVNNAELQVLGTEFNVDAYDKGGQIKTALFKGHVRIRSGEHTSDLFPNQVATFISGQPVTTGNSKVDKEAAWKEGRFIFDSTPITTVMSEMARWYDIEVRYTVKPSTLITCDIARSPDLDKMLALLNLSHAVQLTRDTVNKKLVTVSEWKDKD